MKAIFISYDQAHHEAVLEVLGHVRQRGYTAWQNVAGRGSLKGEPHEGSHAWPAMNAAMLTVVEDDARVAALLERLRALDKDKPALGLRAFVLPVEEAI